MALPQIDAKLSVTDNQALLILSLTKTISKSPQKEASLAVDLSVFRILSTSEPSLPVHGDERWAGRVDRAFAAGAGGFCGTDRQTRRASYLRLRSWLLELNISSVCGLGPSITRSTPATKSCQSFRGFRDTSGWDTSQAWSSSQLVGASWPTSKHVLRRDPVGNSVSALVLL